MTEIILGMATYAFILAVLLQYFSLVPSPGGLAASGFALILLAVLAKQIEG